MTEPDTGAAPTRREFGGLCAGAAAALLGAAPARADATVNDASRMNATPIAARIRYEGADTARAIDAIRREMAEARAARRPLAVAAARHSMGGQSIPRAGTAIEFAPARATVDPARSTYRVTPGTRWRDVIQALEPHGLSPAVMQSNHDFGVIASLCVNAHGWPVPFGPVSSTVRSFRLVLPDGTPVTCSRAERPGLFAATLGGYGLTGVVVSAELDAVPNLMLRGKRRRMPAGGIGPALAAAALSGPVRMAYARLCVSAGDFLDDAHLTWYVPAETQPSPLPAAEAGGLGHQIARRVFRAQSGSGAWKAIRWRAETALSPGHDTRNALMSTPVALMEGTEPGRADILQEYFLPPERLEPFLAACREAIPASGQDLLNVTLRFVRADPAPLLTYCPGDRVGAVFLFDQAATPEADLAMQALTRRLVDAALAQGGSFYLPYRLHATREQLRAAYPRLGEFVALKRSLDPSLTLRNALWDRYVGAQA